MAISGMVWSSTSQAVMPPGEVTFCISKAPAAREEKAEHHKGDKSGGDGGRCARGMVEHGGHMVPDQFLAVRLGSGAGRRTAVTERAGLRIFWAAAFTSSAVTAAMRSGQLSTSATVRPVTSAWP